MTFNSYHRWFKEDQIIRITMLLCAYESLFLQNAAVQFYYYYFFLSLPQHTFVHAMCCSLNKVGRSLKKICRYHKSNVAPSRYMQKDKNVTKLSVWRIRRMNRDETVNPFSFQVLRYKNVKISYKFVFHNFLIILKCSFLMIGHMNWKAHNKCKMPDWLKKNNISWNTVYVRVTKNSYINSKTYICVIYQVLRDNFGFFPCFVLLFCQNQGTQTYACISNISIVANIRENESPV